MSFANDISKTQYFYELEGYMSPELFKSRMQTLDKVVKKTRVPRLLSFFPFFLLVTILSSPLIITEIILMLKSSSEDNNSPSKPFSAYLSTFLTIFGCYLVGFFLWFLFVKRQKTKRNKAINKQLEEFNIIDNPNHLNWRTEIEFEKNEGTNSMVTLERKLVLDIIASYSAMIQLQFPETAFIDINENRCSSTDSVYSDGSYRTLSTNHNTNCYFLESGSNDTEFLGFESAVV
ncbi:4760_t:CDS:2 [Ambispora gerdemannii]|uniref:4760_t:CDS:1 n=1 Tax=Ambispora gerdemannii TaxID=144530 RepID=A0A9N9F598_9GLOM|nr:4760_t:CDS:2 [Ambispora gerdemannii]